MVDPGGGLFLMSEVPQYTFWQKSRDQVFIPAYIEPV